MVTDTGIIILAAGSSRRLGRPKQLLHYQGTTLIRRSIAAAKAAKPSVVVIVVGAAAELVVQEIADKDVTVVFNAAFQEGIASSIRCGLNYLLHNAPEIENIVIMVCDQPHVDAAHLLKLIAEGQKSKVRVAASLYNNQMGVPALFNRALFDELIALKGDSGAKNIIQRYRAEAVALPLPSGGIDIDDEAAYLTLIASTSVEDDKTARS
ncbi:NTP transferase domain-containing protein [Olivibacter sp. XZL3]|uniref:nucleotidyltransferase family protein n=1 Tax=Olivibacter sp. XZL3 TaxID=1735116 RepID=UPI0010658D04|nr:nucleotidyltransferase family protein [Olivibacter sp. XZL3]